MLEHIKTKKYPTPGKLSMCKIFFEIYELGYYFISLGIDNPTFPANADDLIYN